MIINNNVNNDIIMNNVNVNNIIIIMAIIIIVIVMIMIRIELLYIRKLFENTHLISRIICDYPLMVQISSRNAFISKTNTTKSKNITFIVKDYN